MVIAWRRLYVRGRSLLGLHCCRCDMLNKGCGSLCTTPDGSYTRMLCIHHPHKFCPSCREWFNGQMQQMFNDLGNTMEREIWKLRLGGMPIAIERDSEHIAVDAWG